MCFAYLCYLCGACRTRTEIEDCEPLALLEERMLLSEILVLDCIRYYIFDFLRECALRAHTNPPAKVRRNFDITKYQGKKIIQNETTAFGLFLVVFKKNRTCSLLFKRTTAMAWDG